MDMIIVYTVSHGYFILFVINIVVYFSKFSIDIFIYLLNCKEYYIRRQIKKKYKQGNRRTSTRKVYWTQKKKKKQ